LPGVPAYSRQNEEFEEGCVSRTAGSRQILGNGKFPVTPLEEVAVGRVFTAVRKHYGVREDLSCPMASDVR
jgi:hypothetical protein